MDATTRAMRLTFYTPAGNYRYAFTPGELRPVAVVVARPWCGTRANGSAPVLDWVYNPRDVQFYVNAHRDRHPQATAYALPPAAAED